MKNYALPDGLGNVSVKNSGDIVSVIKNPNSKVKGASKELMLTAIKNGGDRLDCYGDDLVAIYAKAGFEPVARVKFIEEYAPDDWDYKQFGKPDIYFMMSSGDNAGIVSEQYGQYELLNLDVLPYMSYEDAAEYRDNLITRRNTHKNPPAQTVSSPVATENNAETNTITDKAQKALNEAYGKDFRTSAEKYGINSALLYDIQKILHRRGTKAYFDADAFTDNKTTGFWNASTDENGNTVREIVLNPNATSKQLLQFVAIHELFHDMQGTDMTNELSSVLRGYAKTQYNEMYKIVSKAYKDKYSNDPEYSKKIDEEVLANILGENLGTQQFINRLVNEKPTLARRIYYWVVDKLAKLDKSHKNERLYWANVKNKYIQAYGQEYAGKTGKAFSINPQFANQYDNWNKEETKGYFVLGTTSEAITSVGIDPKTIRFYKSKIIEIQNKHKGMTDEVIKSVPEVLENPIIVMQSQTRKNRVVAVGELQAEKFNDSGKSLGYQPVICALELMPNGKITNFEILTSAYPRTIQQLINTSDILYVDPNKKRTDNWLQFLRLQLPANVAQYGSIGTVTYYAPNVKNDTENSAMAEALKKYQQKNNDKKYSISVAQSTENNTFKLGNRYASIKQEPNYDDLSKYQVIGIRTVPYEQSGKYKIGDYVDDSYDWDSENGDVSAYYTSGKSLNGASAIGIDSNYITDKASLIESIQGGFKQSNAIYPGDETYIIGGEYEAYGNDTNEVIIRNAKVIGELQLYNSRNEAGNDIRHSIDNDELDNYLKEHYSPKGTGQTIQQLKEAAVFSSPKPDMGKLSSLVGKRINRTLSANEAANEYVRIKGFDKNATIYDSWQRT